MAVNVGQMRQREWVHATVKATVEPSRVWDDKRTACSGRRPQLAAQRLRVQRPTPAAGRATTPCAAAQHGPGGRLSLACCGVWAFAAELGAHFGVQLPLWALLGDDERAALVSWLGARDGERAFRFVVAVGCAHSGSQSRQHTINLNVNAQRVDGRNARPPCTWSSLSLLRFVRAAVANVA